MTAAGLTPRQWALLSFIRGHIAATGSPPSYAQMQAHLGLRSRSGVHRLMVLLVERGRVAALPDGRHRAIRLVEADGVAAGHERALRRIAALPAEAPIATARSIADAALRGDPAP